MLVRRGDERRAGCLPLGPPKVRKMLRNPPLEKKLSLIWLSGIRRHVETSALPLAEAEETIEMP